jgi:hypothetical protein
MSNAKITNILLFIIALALSVIAAKPFFAPHSAQATTESYPLYVEPGMTMLRAPDGTSNLYGKVMIDMSTGNIWGFPTLNQAPYPVDINSTKPPVSHPMLLGNFALQDTTK